jgi:hypothetical protein
MAGLTPNNRPKNNTPKNNSLKNNALKTNTGTPKNNAGAGTTTPAPAPANITENALNKEISNLLGNTTPKNNAGATSATPTNNKPKNANKNNLGNLNNLDNLDELSTPSSANKPGNKNQTKMNENKKDEPSIVDEGINKLNNTLSSIKNTVLGEPTSTPNNQNKSVKNNKNKGDEVRALVALEAESKSETSIWMTVIKVVIMVIVLVAIYYIGNYLITKYLSSRTNSPMLLNTTKNSKNAMVVSQDPLSVNYIPILKSDGQDGIQFTYGFWFLVESVDYKKGEWKHVFHKGNSSSYPNRAPGVWFHPDKNSIRVYMNTQDNILEYADVDEIPVRKWVYMNIILNNKNLDIYINGYLKIRKELSSIPKQNDDDFWVNMYGGFEGYLSNIRYYAYAVDFNEIYNNIKSGPSTNNCIDTGEVPPYMDDNWWFTYNG